MNPVKELADTKHEAIALATELREIADELNNLAEKLETGGKLPGKMHSTSMGDRVRQLIVRYNALKKEIEFFAGVLKGMMNRGDRNE